MPSRACMREGLAGSCDLRKECVKNVIVAFNRNVQRDDVVHPSLVCKRGRGIDKRLKNGAAGQEIQNEYAERL